MGNFLDLLLGTVRLRPYVFVFLLVYIIGCSLNLGLKRTVLFGIAGYLITWLSEFSSIHNGIPYGHYFYMEETRNRELWVWGVPFMDSLSYVFLAYASFSMALLAISPLRIVNGAIRILETKKIRHSLGVTFLGAILMLYLDVIIDPVALRGDKWFLGKIYGYPEEGIYFGVPVANFIGWFLVGFILIYALQLIDRLLARKGVSDFYGHRYPWRFLIGPGLYLGIAVFNLAVAFYIKEYTLVLVDIFILGLPAVLLFWILRLRPGLRESG